MKLKQWLIGIVGIIGCSGALGNLESESQPSFNCELIIQKNSCWEGFELWIKAIEKFSGAEKAEIYIKKDQFFETIKFPCEPEQTYYFAAKFNPLIWEDDKDKSFYSNKVFTAPKHLPSGEETWQIHMCFPDGFSHVSMPLHGMVNCTCEQADEKASSESPETQEMQERVEA